MSLQPFPDDEDAIPFREGSANRRKQIEMTSGTDTADKALAMFSLRSPYPRKLGVVGAERRPASERVTLSCTL